MKHLLAVVSHFVLTVHKRAILASATPDDIASAWSVVGEELIVAVTTPKAVHIAAVEAGAQIVVARSTVDDIGAMAAVQSPVPWSPWESRYLARHVLRHYGGLRRCRPCPPCPPACRCPPCHSAYLGHWCQ
jgi:hypothetical protein